MRRKIVLFLLVLILSVNILALPALAAQIPDAPDEGGVEIQAENTEWRYRIYNGKLQKRLWSIYESKWLTNWIDV